MHTLLNGCLFVQPRTAPGRAGWGYTFQGSEISLEGGPALNTISR